MPNRIVREGILTSESIARLSWAEEVFYRRLMSVADDHGRYYANPKLIRGACYPLLIDKVTDADIGKWLTACVEAALVSVYPASDGKRYLVIQKFGQQVRSKSRFPEPLPNNVTPLQSIDSKCDQVRADAHLDVFVFEDVVVAESTPPIKPKAASGSPAKTANQRRKACETPIPDDFKVSDRVEKWATEHGHTRLQERLDAFICQAKAKGYMYADWDAAFMNAIRNNWARLPATDSNCQQTRVAL